MTPSNTTQGAKRPPIGSFVHILGDVTHAVEVTAHTERGFQYRGGRPISIPKYSILGTGEGELFLDVPGCSWSPTASASPSPVTEETKSRTCEKDFQHYLTYSQQAHLSDADKAMLRHAYSAAWSPTPSPSAPAQQGEITDALAEALEGFLGDGQIEVEIANARAALRAYRLAPPTPSSLSAQGGAGDLHADFVEIVFSTLKEAEQMEEAWMKQFFPDTEEPSSRQRLLAELRGMLDHRLSAYPTPPNAAPEGKQK